MCKLYLILSGVPICLAVFSAGQIGIRKTQKGSNSHARPSSNSLIGVRQIDIEYVFILTSAPIYTSRPYSAHGYLDNSAWAVGISNNHWRDNALSSRLLNMYAIVSFLNPH